jgi:hypothetical protein
VDGELSKVVNLLYHHFYLILSDGRLTSEFSGTYLLNKFNAFVASFNAQDYFKDNGSFLIEILYFPCKNAACILGAHAFNQLKELNSVMVRKSVSYL